LYAPHVCVVVPQVPAPSQVPGSVSVDVVVGHDAAEHDVPLAHFWQPPRPSHLPSMPHVAADAVAQNAGGAAVPAATGAHVPRLPATLQALHEAHEGASQHTPSVQLPLPHWPRSVHVWPRPSLAAHAPALVQ
jgi:hypothetical protein